MLEAATVVVDSSLRGGATPDVLSLDILRRLPLSDARSLPEGERQTVLAGMLMARVRADDVDRALELAEVIRETNLNRRVRETPVEMFLALEAALAECFISLAEPVRGLEHANRMLAALSEEVSPLWSNRAWGIAAAALAIDGNHVRSEQLIRRIHELESEQGWGHDRVEFMHGVAEIMIAFTALDASRVRSLRDRIRAIYPNEPSALSLIQLIEAIDHFLSGDLAAALVAAARVARGADQPNGPALIRECGATLVAVVLIVRGTPAQAIAFSHTVPVVDKHFACLGMVRSSAYLVLGDYRRARKETDACIRAKFSHSRWTFPACLVRRAVANLRLGNFKDAAREAIEALQYTDRLDPSLGFLAIPRADLFALGALLAVQDPRSIGSLRTLISPITRVPAYVAPQVFLPALSKREQVVAYFLRSDLTYGELADKLHVSLSTVKSQAAATIRKVGGSSREDAVEKLERGGFYVLYDPPQD